jgi:hypothetical protein
VAFGHFLFYTQTGTLLTVAVAVLVVAEVAWWTVRLTVVLITVLLWLLYRAIVRQRPGAKS